jgi:hypothetical protein
MPPTHIVLIGYAVQHDFLVHLGWEAPGRSRATVRALASGELHSHSAFASHPTPMCESPKETHPYRYSFGLLEQWPIKNSCEIHPVR